MGLLHGIIRGVVPSLTACALAACGRTSLDLPQPFEPARDDVTFERCPARGVIPLAKADAKIVGARELESAGSSVAGAGDVNGDGFDDLIVGAPYASTAGEYAGAAYLFYGPVRGTLSVLEADATFLGEPRSWAGVAVAGAGDVNGDGFDDLIVGAGPDHDEVGGGAGVAYLIYGPVHGTIRLADADAKLVGEWCVGGAGVAVAGAGDVNGDGLGDLLIGALFQGGHSNCDEAGAAYVLYGPVMGRRSLSLADATMVGNPLDLLGSSVAAAGDVDADGYADFLVGAPGNAKRGLVYLVRGPVMGAVNLSTAAAVLVGEDSDDSAGEAVAGGHDVDGDSVPDIVVGARGDDTGGEWAGAAYVIGGGVTGSRGLAQADAKFFGVQAHQNSGASVASIGDCNGDGFGDVLVGTGRFPSAMPGIAYLLYGPMRGSASLAKAGASFVAEADGEYAGPVAGVGDLNGDGVADMAIASPNHDGTQRAAGAVYVFYGCQ